MSVALRRRLKQSMQSQDLSFKKQELLESRKRTIATKRVLNIEEVAIHTDYDVKYVYHLVQKKIIPSSNPTGGALRFDRLEVEEWMLSKRSLTQEDIEDKANAYLRKNKLKSKN